LALGTPARAAEADCLVTNAVTNQTFTALQEAVDVASPGHRLTVEGTCHGRTTIDKDLAISGIETAASGSPVLEADGLVVALLGAVVTIEDLRIVDLTLEDGATPGGRRGVAVANTQGTLTLRNVVVRANRAWSGGEIYSTGTLMINGASSIEHRGGVYSRGALVMNGASSISETDGLGVFLKGGSLTMNGHSSIHDNRGGVGVTRGTIVMNDRGSIRDNDRGGGVRLIRQASLTMNDSTTIAGNGAGGGGGGVKVREGSALAMNGSATITDNTADLGYPSVDFRGGGVYSDGGSLVGVICAPKANANVFGNRPDDCAR
jgi:hypothetical protein